jgi:uncharacterized integral membrane protein
MRRISWVVTIPVTIIALVFAIANRAPTEINLWPLPWRATLPLYLVILLSLLVGFLVGAAIAMLSAGRRRHQSRARLRAANEELAALQRRQAAAAAATGRDIVVPGARPAP